MSRERTQERVCMALEGEEGEEAGRAEGGGGGDGVDALDEGTSE